MKDIAHSVDGCGLYKETYASNYGKVTNGGSGFWWQIYYRGGRQMMSMQRKQLSVGSYESVRGCGDAFPENYLFSQ